MRVLIASSPHRDTFGYSMPPPGLLRLGGELLRRGYDVRLEDLAFRLGIGAISNGDEMCADAARWLLRDGELDVLGLSTMGATLPAALAIAGLVRKHSPATRILFGGPGTQGIDRELVERFSQVDAVVRGEGEVTVPEILEQIEAGNSLEGVDGVTWRNSENEVVREADRDPIADLASLPEYARSLLEPLASYKQITGEADGLIPIDSGRGCVYDCSFCTIGRYWGRRSRTLPVARLVDEILEIRQIDAARSAYLCHDIFGADRDYALEFCDAMIAQGSPVPWECRARIDHIDEELAERMGRAGCYRVLFGIESGDPNLRNQHDKHLNVELDLLARIEACARHGVIPILSIILGLPGEDREALARSLDFAAQAGLASGVQISFHLVNPQPGCTLGEELAASSKPVEGIPPDMALGAGETTAERELIDAHPDLFSTWSLLTSLPGGEAHLRVLHKLTQRVPDLLMRYPRTFLALCRQKQASAIDVLEEFDSYGRSFEAFVRVQRNSLLKDVIHWEQAILRAPLLAKNETDRTIPERLKVNFEPVDLESWLREQRDDCPLAKPNILAVCAGARGVRTVKITSDVAELLECLDSAEDLEALISATPGMAEAIAQLNAVGLLS
ncbi:MAG: anaerobic magnesium-protoporphyrin IX monomethyl ester cyclase [Planctomycetota bacterium]|jgi:anaerobic magnesium-protoporphyrin IX monomethyl ester cyclase